MSNRKLNPKDVKNFDPFKFNLLFVFRKNKPTYLIGLVGLGMVALLLVVNFAQGTIGVLSATQFVDDIKRALGMPNVSPSQPNFPLLRDIASWFLLFAVISGGMLLHKQWKLMAACLEDLATNGALIRRKEINQNALTRILGVNRMLKGWKTDMAAWEEAKQRAEAAKGTADESAARNRIPPEPKDPLNITMSRTMSSLYNSRGVIATIIVVLSIILTFFLLRAQQNGLLQPFAPHELTGAARETWLKSAYASWWAGQNHYAGLILYFFYAFAGMFVILSFNLAGIIAVYVVVLMNCVAQPSADWSNRDGRYGWTPVARIFQTLYWADVLLGTTLTVVLFVLGLHNFWWVGPLVLLYIFVLPIETVIPWLVFRRVERFARKERLDELAEIVKCEGIDLERDVVAAGPFLAEIDRCRAARIRPMRLRRGWFSTFLLLVLLPVILAAAQILFPLEFGGS